MNGGLVETTKCRASKSPWSLAAEGRCRERAREGERERESRSTRRVLGQGGTFTRVGSLCCSLSIESARDVLYWGLSRAKAGAMSFVFRDFGVLLQDVLNVWVRFRKYCVVDIEMMK